MAHPLQRPTITSLSDEVLLKSMEYLTLDELCSVRQTCQRFHTLSNQLFEANHADHVEFDNLIDNMQPIRRIIRCFGPLIKNLTINGSFLWELNHATMNLVNINCKLTNLRLICFRIDKSIASQLKQVLQFVEKLEILYCPINIERSRSGFEQIFQLSEELHELTIVCPSASLDSKFLTLKFKSLKKLNIIVDQLTDEKNLATFFNNHSKLQHFSYLPQSIKTPSTWSKAVLSRKLEGLGLQMTNDKEIDLIVNMNRLKRIVIDCSQCDRSIVTLVTALAEIDTLETVSLWSMKYSMKFCNALVELKEIKTLELRQFSGTCDLKEMISANLGKKLKSLKNLYLDSTCVRTATDVELLARHFRKLDNLYLCDMKNVYLLPDTTQLDTWCQSIAFNMNIFIDSRYIAQLQNNNNNVDADAVKFIPFKSFWSQKLNVLIEI